MRIELGLTGANGQIYLNGRNISEHIRAFTLKGSASGMTTLDLELSPNLTTVRADEVKVTLPPEVEDILEEAGWTPPGSCAQGCR